MRRNGFYFFFYEIERNVTITFARRSILICWKTTRKSTSLMNMPTQWLYLMMSQCLQTATCFIWTVIWVDLKLHCIWIKSCFKIRTPLYLQFINFSKHHQDCLDTRSHLDLSQNERLYVYITSNYSEETQIGESLAENIEAHDVDCSFNLRLENFENWNDNGYQNPFNNSIMMDFQLTKW